jgi:hypothetical protein
VVKRNQSKAPPAPPAKKPRKATISRDVENVDPKRDACVNSAKMTVRTSSEPEVKKSRKEVLKLVALDKGNVTIEQDVCTKSSELIAPTVTESKNIIAVARTSVVDPADPVSQRVAVVQSAFDNDNQVGLLELPSDVREILRIAVPRALGHGSAADERHDMQIRMVETIGGYLKEVMQLCSDQAKAEEELVKTAEMSKQQDVSTLAALEATLLEKVHYVQEKHGNLNDAEQALSAAKAKVPEKEMETLDVQLEKTCSERDQYQKVITSSFYVLKACDWSSSAEQKRGEKKLFGPLKTLVKQIGADPSLVEAASNALAKNPSQRGEFDVMVVDQLEAVLRQPLTVLDEQIREQEIIKQKKATQLQECNAAVSLMEQQLSSCRDELAACQKEQSDLENRIKELTTTAQESDQKLERARSSCDNKVSLFEQANESLEAFKFLHERRVTPVTPVPERVSETPSTATEASEPSSTATEASSEEIPAEIAHTDASLPVAAESPDVVLQEAEDETLSTNVAPPTEDIMDAEQSPLDSEAMQEQSPSLADEEVPGQGPEAEEAATTAESGTEEEKAPLESEAAEELRAQNPEATEGEKEVGTVSDDADSEDMQVDLEETPQAAGDADVDMQPARIDEMGAEVSGTQTELAVHEAEVEGSGEKGADEAHNEAIQERCVTA